MQLHLLLLPLLLSLSASSLYLLDPNTGRPIGQPRRSYWTWRQAEVLQQVHLLLDQVSDQFEYYISALSLTTIADDPDRNLPYIQ